MKKLFPKLLQVGVQSSLSLSEQKRITLLNLSCITAYFSNISIILLSLFLGETTQVWVLTLATLCTITVHFLQYLHHYVFARIFFTLFLYLLVCVFAFWLQSDIINTYCFGILALNTLMFFKRNWGFLIFSIFITYIPQWIILIQTGVWTIDLSSLLHTSFIFGASYSTVLYFKTMNIKNEAALSIELKKAIKTQHTIEKQHKQLEELNKFQSHFLVNLSHEIRTPLTIIKGNLNQLLKTIKLKTQQDQGNTILRNSNKIQELIDEIIDLAKMNNHKLELRKKATDPIDFIRKLIASFSGLYAQKNMELSMHDKTIGQNLQIDLDGVYLERAFSNLLLNAYKYTAEEGAVAITTMADATSLFVEVSDSGYGISQEDLPYVFDTFYQAKNNVNQAGGSGVGLSFSKEVILLHEGDITVKSTVDVGSTFTIRLPLTKTISKTVNVPKKTTLNIVEKKNLLLVEDNLDMRSYLTSILQDFNVTEAINGQEGLDILETFKPDIIITDYMMPVMDGLTFIKKAKKRGIDCPVIVLTARTDEEGKLDFLRLGIDDYLTKPFNEEELKIRIEHAIHNNSSRTAFLDNDPSLDTTTEELKSITSVIQDNIQSATFGVPELAERLTLNERTLYRKIKAITGLTPNGLIRELKLLEAQKICSAQKVNSISELAQKFGFKNGNYFAKLYKERFGKDILLQSLNK